MNGISSVSENLDLKYFKKVALKHCPTVYEEINEYEPVEPPEPPQELMNFLNTTSDYKRTNGKPFYSQDFIQDFLNENWKLQSTNHNNFMRLIDLLEEYRDHPTERHAIEVKILRIKSKILSYKAQIPALSIDFRKYLINEKADAEQVAWDE